MSTDITHIKKVEIKGLWGRQDLVWELHPDVNILAGANGSGKSTILDCLNTILSADVSNGPFILANEINVFFDNEQYLKCKKGKSPFKQKSTNDIEVNFDSEVGKGMNRVYSSPHGSLYLGGLTDEDIQNSVRVELLKTFDVELKPSEAVKKLSNDNVETELDWQISLLQTEFLDYQLDLSKEKDRLLDTSNNPKEEIDKLRYPQNRFWEMLDTLFAETGKKVDRNANEVSFLLDGQTLSPYVLSSGEKQILVILLTVLIQNQKPSILFMDEPEISLHIDWQKKLIGYIRELNPNVQIILATHSPALIMEGWHDKVFEVSDLVVNK